MQEVISYAEKQLSQKKMPHSPPIVQTFLQNFSKLIHPQVNYKVKFNVVSLHGLKFMEKLRKKKRRYHKSSTSV